MNADEDVDLYFRGYYWLALRYMGATGTLYQCDEGSPETWTCQATMGESDKRSPFGIYDTDYETYEIMYNCEQMGWLKNEWFSVNTREEQASEETMAAINEIIREKIPQYDLNTSWGLTYNNQGSSCTYDWQWDESDSESVLEL